MKNQLKLAALITVTSLMSLTATAQKKAPAKAAKPATSKTAAASKPTKLETMDWIAGKMKENLAFPREFVSYSNGVFVYKKELGGGGVSKVCTSTFDLNKITTISNEYSDDFFVGGKGLCVSQCTDSHNINQYDFTSISGPDYNDYGKSFDFKDKTLLERLRKAFDTLIEYNGSKQAAGEKF